MKFKNQLFITTGVIVSFLTSCSNEIKPIGKYSLGNPDNTTMYLSEFKEEGIVKIWHNNERETNNLLNAIQRKEDLTGNIWNTLRGMKNIDMQFVNSLAENRQKYYALMSSNDSNKNSIEYFKKIITIQLSFITLSQFSNNNPQLVSNNNFIYMLREFENIEIQINKAFTDFELKSCSAIGEWDTNYGGDIIISNISSDKCKDFTDFNGQYKTCKEPDCIIGIGNYTKNQLLLKPINN